MLVLILLLLLTGTALIVHASDRAWRDPADGEPQVLAQAMAGAGCLVVAMALLLGWLTWLTATGGLHG